MSAVGFEMTDDARMLREGFRDTLAGNARDGEPPPPLEEPTFDAETWRRIAEGGWPGLAIAQAEDELADGPASTLVHLSEEVGAQLAAVPFAITAALVVPLLLATGDDDSPVSLDGVVGGRELVTIALPVDGDVLAPNWRGFEVVEEKGSRVRISGSARPVLFAAQADTLLLPISRADGSLTVAAVDSSSIELEEEELDLARPMAAIAADGVWLQRDALLGAGGDLRSTLNRLLRNYMLCVDGESVGAARAALQQAVDFSASREQFGVPIGSFQAVKHQLADAFGEIEIAAAQVHRTARLLDEGDRPAGAEVLCSRILAADMYPRVLERCIQCHGGVGFTWEAGLQGWYRQALFYRHHPFPLRKARRSVWEVAIGADQLRRQPVDGR